MNALAAKPAPLRVVIDDTADLRDLLKIADRKSVV